MAPRVRDVMTPDPVTLDRGATLVDAAKKMDEADIGDVIVLDGGSLWGLVTDRDIVVRAVAKEKDPRSTPIGEIATTNPVTVSAEEDLTAAGDLMREHAIRRLPVVADGKPVGVISLGDLAIERDPDSALGEISSAPADN